MRILHISNYYAPVGGAETYLLRILKELEARGHHNVVIYTEEHGRTVRDDHAVYYVPIDERAGCSTSAASSVAKVVRDERPDVVFFNSVQYPEIIELVARLIPTVAYIHSVHPCCPGVEKYLRRCGAICDLAFSPVGCAFNIYLRRCAYARHPHAVYRLIRRTDLLQRACKRISRLLVASSYMKGLLHQNRFDVSNIEVLPLFVDMPDKKASTIRGIEELPLILYIGRLEPAKGVPYLLEAVRLQRKPCRLILAGDGSCEKPYLDLARQLHIEDRVHFAGWLSRPALAKLFMEASVLVLPSIWPEPFGLVGPEAMFYGIPVVAFAVGGVEDWLEDGRNGFLVEPQNSVELAEKLEILLQDRPLAQSFGEYGRQQVKEKYAVNAHVERLIQVFSAVK